MLHFVMVHSHGFALQFTSEEFFPNDRFVDIVRKGCDGPMIVQRTLFEAYIYISISAGISERKTLKQESDSIGIVTYLWLEDEAGNAFHLWSVMG